MSYDKHWPWALSQGYARLFRAPEVITAFLQGVTPGKRCVDVGCGYGEVGAALDKGGATVVLGVDVSSDAAAYTKKRYPQLLTCVAALPELPLPTQHFDTVVCRNVLHMVDELVPAMSELARIATLGGIVLIETPIAFTIEEQQLLEKLEHHIVKRRFYSPDIYNAAAAQCALREVMPRRVRVVERTFGNLVRDVTYARFCWQRRWPSS